MKSEISDGYLSFIQQATGAPDWLLRILENIMRDEIFHRTLDRQSRGELMAGAAKAHAIYRRDPGMYDSVAFRSHLSHA